ncbi:hypothetical protein J4N42_21245 [Vibrio sp. SCSIO 43135]|uniref:calcium-binding protein n=1 Tax=Vibrio sp. SCSIO 43135 TaxID=2819096 RepID=UPI002075FBCE|nr:hypothetical protein [Vibrio sp. SCSIO 43135]USD43123.1 hypothetical protein J4N42_21245 [Vibrio sp. SCSIO 43135]
MFNNVYEDLKAAVGDVEAVSGTQGDDVITSAEAGDVVLGLSGDDTIEGNSDNNVLIGNTGHDYITGGAGDDLIQGGVGQDSLFGAKGNDRIVATLDDKMVAGGKGFDVVYVKNDTEDTDTFDFVSQARGIEGIVGYGDEPVYANVSLSSIMGQSQDDGNEETPDTDNTLLAVGLEGLSLEGIRKFSDSGELQFSSEDITGDLEDAYIEMLGLSFVPDGKIDLHAFTFGEGENTVTIITDLSESEITVGGESLVDMAPV